MRMKGSLIAVAGAFFLMSGACAQEVEDFSAAARSNNAFAMDLYARLKDGPGNLFFSPYSISTALTMTYAGARESTARQMAQVLHMMGDDEGIHEALGRQMAAFGEGKGYELTIANSLWGQKEYVFLPEFLSVLEDNYGAALEQVDFTKPQIAAGLINAWVSDRTREKIKDIVSSDTLGELTRLVLVNAVYFKGAWELPFKKIHTQNQRFYRSAEDNRPVPMMNQLGSHMAYTEDAMVQVLEMAYAGDDLAMMIILPKDIEGLKDLEGILNVEDQKTWAKNLGARQVDVTLPKFKNTSSFGLAEVLGAMGMPEAFSGSADFSGMSDESGLLISNVLHKAFVDVSEEGTEAAAATAVVMNEAIAFQEPSQKAVAFVADHPFIYLIRDRRTNTILFMGRVMDPEVGFRPVSEVLGGMWGEVVGQALQSRVKQTQ